MMKVWLAFHAAQEISGMAQLEMLDLPSLGHGTLLRIEGWPTNNRSLIRRQFWINKGFRMLGQTTVAK